MRFLWCKSKTTHSISEGCRTYPLCQRRFVDIAERRSLVIFEAVEGEIGTALNDAQFGGKHRVARPWRGAGTGVLEVEADHRGNLTVLSPRFAFSGQSRYRTVSRNVARWHSHAETTPPVSQRLGLAREDPEERYGGRTLENVVETPCGTQVTGADTLAPLLEPTGHVPPLIVGSTGCHRAAHCPIHSTQRRSMTRRDTPPTYCNPRAA